MTWILLFSIVSAAVSGFLVFGVMRRPAEAERASFDQERREYENTIADLEKQVQEAEKKCEEIRKANVGKYTTYISGFLDKAANQSDSMSKALEAVSEKITSLSHLIDSVNETTDSTSHASTYGLQYVNAVATNLEGFSQAKEGLVTIQNQFAVVQEKTEAIRFVGEEAEMLALNAAIEAARAGEAGRGFAVVADAMKSLSRNSQATTVDIQKIVSESEQTISKIVQEFVERSDTLNEAIEKLMENFKQIESSLTEISSKSDTIHHDSNASSKELDNVEGMIKTALEGQVKDLSNLVSVITGVEVINLNPQQAKQSLGDFDEIIDVRRPEEWNGDLGHIAQAKLSTLQTDFKAYVKQLDKDKKYLFVCRSGGRSTKAAQTAITNGVTQAYNLDGGMLAWREQFPN